MATQRATRRTRQFGIRVGLLLSLLAACGKPETRVSVEQPEIPAPQRGASAIQEFGCGACHVIPGIPGAHGIVGPPLSHIAERAYLAGILANTPDNMIRWLRDPPAVDPATAMPNVGLSESHARDIAAYLYSLR